MGGRPAARGVQARCASECPIHWTESFEEFPEEAGFWSVTTADDIHAVSRDWQTYSSEQGGVSGRRGGFPLELARAMFIGMDPPKHDRLKALFQARLHAAADRRPRGARSARSRSRCSTASRAASSADLVSDVAQPVVARVIGSFMGISEEEDEIWARLMNSVLGAMDPDLNPEGVEGAVEKDVPEIFERCQRADRRASRASHRRPHERAGARRSGRRAASRSTRS